MVDRYDAFNALFGFNYFKPTTGRWDGKTAEQSPRKAVRHRWASRRPNEQE